MKHPVQVAIFQLLGADRWKSEKQLAYFFSTFH